MTASVLSTAALAQTPNLSHTTSGSDVRWKNGCLAPLNSKGEAMDVPPECNDKQIATSEATVASYMASHGSGGGNRAATLTKKGHGTFGVVWKTDCIAESNRRGKATVPASTCNDTEIAVPTRMGKDDRKNA